MTVCIAGHAGIAHNFGHSGLVQDDAQGFSAAAGILKKNIHVDTSIKDICFDDQEGSLFIFTASGGCGKARPRRGFTPFEKEMLSGLKGMEATLPQVAVLKIFGRFYGHGVTEVPASVEFALAEAAIDSFARNIEGFVIARRDSVWFSDIIGGIKVDPEGSPLVIMLSINGSRRGIGPNEDLEGNIPLSIKKEVMEKLQIMKTPTIILESKAFVPALKDIETDHFLVRFNSEIDNTAVGYAIEKALKDLELPYILKSDAFPEDPGLMKRGVEKVADMIGSCAELLRNSTTSEERVQIGADLASIISEDYGGAIFMSDPLHVIVRAAGLLPGTAAVISRIVPPSYVRTNIIPFTTEEDIEDMARVALAAARNIERNPQKAMQELESKYSWVESF